MIYAVGDVHGCNKTLNALINKLALTSKDTVIFLGDYVDRGPDSKGVISTLIELKKYYEVITLLGNHEQMMIYALRDNDDFSINTWISNGGYATWHSYSGNSLDVDTWQRHIPDDHKEFFESLQIKYETDTHFFCHAGINPCISLDKQDEEDLLWIRRMFILNENKHEKMIVHGHTPWDKVEIKHNRICVDTGCVFGNKLSAINIDTNEVISVKNIEDE